jgi:hypothetical protein
MKGRPRSSSGHPGVDRPWCDDRIDSVETLFAAHLIDDPVPCSADARVYFWGLGLSPKSHRVEMAKH